MTSPHLNETGGSTPRDLPNIEPRQTPLHTLQNVDVRLSDLQVGQSELQLSLKYLTKSIENAKLPELAVKIDHLNRTVEAAKLSELAFKVESLIKSVEGAKLPEMTTKLDNIKQSADGTKSKVEGLEYIKAMVVGGFAVLAVMLGIIGWILKSGFDFYTNLQSKTAQSQLVQSHTAQPSQYSVTQGAAPQQARSVPQQGEPSSSGHSQGAEAAK